MAETNTASHYEGSIVRVGNSRGMRLPARFFQAHPEFAGKVQLTVVADGAVLMSAKRLSEHVQSGIRIRAQANQKINEEG